MGIEDLVKQYLPIVVLILYFGIFKRRIKHLTLPTELVVLSSAIFSSNFQFFYRELGQIIVVIYILYSYVTNKRIEKIKYAKILCVYAAFILLSIVGNSINFHSLNIAVTNYISISFTAYYLVKSCRDEKVRLDVFGVYTFLGIIISVVSVLEFLMTSTRSEVTFSNSNFASMFILVSLVFSLDYLKKTKSKMVYLVAIIMLVGIIGTGSRTTFVIGLLVLFLQLLSVKNMIKMSIPFVFVLAVLGSSLGETMFSRYDDIEEDASVLERLEIIEASKEIIKTHPINGIGYGQFQVQFMKYLPISVADLLLKRDEIVTHNDYLRIADELGLIAFAICIMFIVSLLLRIYKQYGIDSSYIGMLLAILVFSTTHNNLNSFVTWYIIGICYEATRKSIKGKNIPSTSQCK